MANVAVVGSQWGDEGKGKIVDWLSERADVIVRCQGGHNAGHTLVIGDKTYKLSLLPSGVVREGKLAMIGNGVVVDPQALIDAHRAARDGDGGPTPADRAAHFHPRQRGQSGETSSPAISGIHRRSESQAVQAGKRAVGTCEGNHGSRQPPHRPGDRQSCLDASFWERVGRDAQ